MTDNFNLEPMNDNIKPFLKWAGGKSQLISELSLFYPFTQYKINKYIEPFVGGGAVLFDILNKYQIDDIFINDINPELINTYNTIKNDVDALIYELTKLQNEYYSLDLNEKNSFYNKQKELFNTLKFDCRASNVSKAALFIFLNRTCFNGLYRVNQKGLFNVPIGSYNKPLICDDRNLKLISKKLKNAHIFCGSYDKLIKYVDKNTFIYLDPPYRPLNNTSNFTSYTEYPFNDAEQIALSKFIKKIDSLMGKFILSNSDPKNADINDTFFDDLYKKYYINRIYASRMINSKASKRGKITELLITNISVGDDIMKKQQFNNWLNEFKTSIASYDYYTDFNKVFKNIDAIKIELNLLNSLIGSKNIEHDFIQLVKKYPDTLKCIPILLAVRTHELSILDTSGEHIYDFKNSNLKLEDYRDFMKKTGLFDLLSNHIIHSLVDYVTGIEVGLDSNARKNRGGHLMEDLVEKFILKAGFKRDINYFKEMYIHQITDKWNIDLSAISNQGKTEKRFDFVIKTPSMIYAIETNFYASSGSKLNETARSYKNLALESNTIPGFTFIWFTDGKGWKNARHNLEETYDIMEHIYNIKDLEENIIEKVII